MEIHGMRGAEAAHFIEEAIDQLETMIAYEGESNIRAEYDARNGWGTVLTTAIFLAKILNSCQKYPFDIVEVT